MTLYLLFIAMVLISMLTGFTIGVLVCTEKDTDNTHGKKGKGNENDSIN